MAVSLYCNSAFIETDTLNKEPTSPDLIFHPLYKGLIPCIFCLEVPLCILVAGFHTGCLFHEASEIASRRESGVGLAATAEGGYSELVRDSAEVGPMAISLKDILFLHVSTNFSNA